MAMMLIIHIAETEIKKTEREAKKKKKGGAGEVTD